MRSTLWVDVPLAALLPAGDEARVTVPRPMKGEDWACAMARRQTDAELVFYWDGDSLRDILENPYVKVATSRAGEVRVASRGW